MRNLRTHRALLVAATTVVLVAGCTNAPPSPPASPTTSGPVASETPSVSASTPSPQPSVELAALAAYGKFWDAKVASQADPTKDPPKALRTYAIDKALADALATVLLLRRNGVEMTGQPAHNAKVANVEAGKQPVVSITDCLDSTDWRPVVAATGESALAPGQSPRVVVESIATVYDGRWVIKTSTAFRDRSC